MKKKKESDLKVVCQKCGNENELSATTCKFCGRIMNVSDEIPKDYRGLINWCVFLGTILIVTGSIFVKGQIDAKKERVARERYESMFSDEHPELKAYYEFLVDDSWIKYYEENYYYKEMAVFDLHNDGVYEVAVRYSGESYGNYTTGLLTYSDNMIADLNHAQDNNNMGYPLVSINEPGGKYILTRTRGKAVSTIMELQKDGKSSTLDSYFQPYMTEEEIISLEKDLENFVEPIWVNINEENLVFYLTGNGNSTGVNDVNYYE